MLETSSTSREGVYRFTPEMLDAYLKKDRVLTCLQANECVRDKDFTTHQWLLDMPEKRLIFEHMYPELFIEDTPVKILDIAGGYSSLTRKLVKHHEYTLVDLMVHDSHELVKSVADEGNFPWACEDWNDFKPQTYDVIVANDIFPNADQRLDMFIEKYLPYCKILRISITCYNNPQFYRVQRVDAAEILHIQAWGGVPTERVLLKYENRIQTPNLDILKFEGESLFKNQRQVFFVELRGDI